MTYKEVYKCSVSEQKRKENKYDIWVTYVLRPLSILFTIPLVGKKVSPTTITKISVLCCLIGFFILAFGDTFLTLIIGWFFFFLWSLLDCIDGNVARCNNACSQLGDLWDTTGGYTAMVLVYFAAGILAFKNQGEYVLLDNHYYLILGSATSLMSIFPRLVMHKKKSSNINSNVVKEISDKTKFSLSQIMAMNIVAPTGCLLIIFLLSIIFNITSLFVIVYFILNLAIMTITLHKLLNK